MRAQTTEMQPLKELFINSGQSFFAELFPCLQKVYGVTQLLVISRPLSAGSSLRLEYSAGFPADFPFETVLAGGLAALDFVKAPVWEWSEIEAECIPADPLFAALGAETCVGATFEDGSADTRAHLLLYGPSGLNSSQLLQQLHWIGWRTGSEVLRLRREQDLIRRADFHQSVLNALPMPIFYQNIDGKYLGCNGAFESFLNKTQEEIIGREVDDVAPPDLGAIYRRADQQLLVDGGEQVFETSVVNGSGERREVIFHKAVFYDEAGNQQGISGTLVDVTRLRAVEDEARYLAHFDIVTGLPNQTLLRDRLEQELLHAQHGSRELAVLCLDLDCFKRINNVYGHDFGDRVLAEVAGRLRGSLEEEDTIARLGGDSFIAIVQLRPGRRPIREVALHLQEVVRRPIELDGRQLFLTASLGIALYPHDGRDACALLSHADAAQARAKETELGSLMFFTAAMNTAVSEQLLLEEHLRRAIDEDQFFLLYQPQVDAATGRVIGAEALLRWQHPQWGLVSPERFVPLAEQTRLIRQLGETVLEQACRQARIWQEERVGELRVTVNISPMQFQDDDLLQRVRRILARTGLNPRRLGLEITETEVMRDFDHAIHALTRFRELGLHLAIDDFGTGYSSLSYLKHFPIDLLKIDRSFTAELPENGDDAAIVTAIIALGRSLGLKVLAEGVETAAQERFLTGLGCAAFQGFYYGHPLPAEEFERLLRQPLVVHD